MFSSIPEIVSPELVTAGARGRRAVAAAGRHGAPAAVVPGVVPPAQGLAARVRAPAPVARGRGGRARRDMHLPRQVPRLRRGLRVPGDAGLRGGAQGAQGMCPAFLLPSFNDTPSRHPYAPRRSPSLSTCLKEISINLSGKGSSFLAVSGRANTWTNGIPVVQSRA